MRRLNRSILVSLAAFAAALGVVLGAQASGTASDAARKPPLIGGYYAGKSVTYLLTDVSQKKDASDLSKATKFPVAYVPRLNRVPEGALARLYLFTNGVSGPNPFGFQANILDSVPGQPKYSPLWRVYAVAWNASATPRLLKSERQVLAGKAAGQLTITRTQLIKNSPVVPS